MRVYVCAVRVAIFFVMSLCEPAEGSYAYPKHTVYRRSKQNGRLVVPHCTTQRRSSWALSARERNTGTVLLTDLLAAHKPLVPRLILSLPMGRAVHTLVRGARDLPPDVHSSNVLFCTKVTPSLLGFTTCHGSRCRPCRRAGSPRDPRPYQSACQAVPRPCLPWGLPLASSDSPQIPHGPPRRQAERLP